MIGFRGRKTRWLLWALLLVSIATPAVGQSEVARTIDSLLDAPALRHGVSGVLVESMRDGRTVYARNADKAFVPGSNMKLLTTAAALDMLGPSFRYKTTLRVSGKHIGHALRGDVYIEGGGDPTLRTQDLESFARGLRKLGIRRIEGGVVGDESRFGKAERGFAWAWDDEQWYYAAPAGALNLNRNAVEVFVRPGRKAGQPAVVWFNPPSAYLKVENNTVTTAPGGKASVTVNRQHRRNVVVVSGNVPIGYFNPTPEERVSVDDPALYAATALTEALLRAGVSVYEPPRVSVTPASARAVFAHQSPPLSEILALVNKPSDNLIAQVLFRSLAAQAHGPCTDAESVNIELAYLKRIGGDAGAVVIADGAGLSRRDFISPANIVDVLRHAYAGLSFGAFFDSLPIAGRDGTLSRRMKGTVAEGNVRGKTGYLSNVSALSGYLTTASGETLAFSILMNNHLCGNTEAKAVQDAICVALCGVR